MYFEKCEKEAKEKYEANNPERNRVIYIDIFS